MTVKRDSSLLKCRKQTCKNAKCLKLLENNGTWDSGQTENAVFLVNSIGRTLPIWFLNISKTTDWKPVKHKQDYSSNTVSPLMCWQKRTHNTVQVRISTLFPFTCAQIVPYIEMILTELFICWESRSIKHYLGKVCSHSLSSRTCQCLHISTLNQVGLKQLFTPPL